MKKQIPPFYKEVIALLPDTLDKIFINQKPADKAIESVMRLNKKWHNEKRRFFAEAVYDFVRYRRLLEETAATYFNTSEVTYNSLIVCWLVFKEYELPQTGIYKNVKAEEIQKVIDKLSGVRKIRESIPDWLDLLCEKEIGKDWDEILSVLNSKPPLTVRVNYLKTNLETLQKKLAEERVKTLPLAWCEGALEVQGFVNLFRTELFSAGWYEMQDAGSQTVVNSLDIKPGMRVIDACAGAGGKTLHMASLMNNKGKIIALDTKEWRLAELKKRARRAGVDIVESKIIDTGKATKRLANTADRLLLDVPCSGLGVLRRNPDTKWKLNPEKLEELKKEQRHILFSYSQMLKPGGKMVYATCSILPSEGEEQVKNFLAEKKDEWNLLSENRISPAKNNCDGFYIAVLERKK